MGLHFLQAARLKVTKPIEVLTLQGSPHARCQGPLEKNSRPYVCAHTALLVTRAAAPVHLVPPGGAREPLHCVCV